MKSLEQKLSRVDLNLLISLSVLLKERNVTRAAQKLYLSQPAMSRTLKRLRDTFDDPLFYRESSGLQATERAEKLEEPLFEILNNIQEIINATRFTPITCELTFKISVPPLMSNMISAPIAKALTSRAPESSLIEYPASYDSALLLKDREVDFSFHIYPPDSLTEFNVEHIGDTYAVIYADSSHPLVSDKSVSLSKCLEYKFVDYILDIRSGSRQINPLDLYLGKKGKAREVAFRSGQINTLVESMINTDNLLVATHGLQFAPFVTDRLVPIYSFIECADLQAKIYLIEHKRTQESAPHQWFKKLMVETLLQKGVIFSGSSH